MSSVRVIRGGMLTTIQDSGRWGYQSRGVPVAGPMDPMSHRLANALVGNDRGAATLEVTLLGPELEFEDERVVAVTGADFEITLDGKPALAGAPFIVSAESHLRFGPRRRGARAYLAMGGGGGRALKAGDRLPLGVAEVTRPTAAPLGDRLVPLPAHPARLRVLPGPQADAFAADAFDALQSAPYTVGHQSDRMGFRLVGPPLAHARGADIISDATPLGVLQVPASGQPILLMADRQTAGGYPKLATVISADIGVAGQLGPGDTLLFAVCSPREAMAALIAQERAVMALRAPDAGGRQAQGRH